MLGVLWKIQEICSKTITRISKIDGEMSEIMEPKVGNPWNSVSRNWAILSHPWNLTFFEDEIFQLCSHLYGSKVPKWNFAHSLLWKKAENIRKTPKNTVTEDNLTEWPGIYMDWTIWIWSKKSKVDPHPNFFNEYPD